LRKFTSILLAAVVVVGSMQSVSANEQAIWEKLQGSNPKGYVLLMRHAYAPGVGDPANFKIGDCSTQRNLSAKGRKDAAEIGSWLKSKQIKVLRVESSRWCRAKETADLLELGKVRMNKNLDSLFQTPDPVNSIQTAKIRQQIIKHRQSRGLLVMVGHFVNVSALTGVSLDSGEGVLVRANSRGQLKVVGYSPAPK
jgi:phosphohistidine phosphatase SixA